MLYIIVMTQDQIKQITLKFKTAIEKKYPLVDMKLFGSSARGDRSKESDIDIMVRLAQVNRQIEEDVFNMAYDLELEHDCLIDVFVLSNDMGNNIPLVQTIEKEGITV